MVKQLFVGDFFPVFHSAKMLYLYAVFPPDVIICPLFELHHFRVFPANGIGCPYVRGGYPIQAQAPRHDDIQHLHTVFAVADAGDILHLLAGNM